MISPGQTIGVLGGGQLGRMLAQAATRLGYRVHIYEPQRDCPAGAVAHEETNAAYEDATTLAAFARGCAVVTYEFENVPSAPLRAIEALTQLRPHWSVLATCQNRSREKNWLRENGFPHARFAEVAAGGDLAAGVADVGRPCVVKTADFGYDGKGQLKLRTAEDVADAARAFAGRACVIERWIDFTAEISVVVARGAGGALSVFPAAENIHTNHVLDFSIVPARVPAATRAAAEDLGRRIAERIGLVGVMGVEMFVTKSGELLVNELAPRTHNSGHYTIDACVTSQFEQQVRAICDLPLGDPRLLTPVVMVNILGDAWFREPGAGSGEQGAPSREPGAGKAGLATEPAWERLLAEPDVKLHLYGKAEPRPGRKMGHFTVTAASPDAALQRARELKARLVTR